MSTRTTIPKVFVTAVSSDHRIAAIKELRAITGIGLKEVQA